MPTGGHRLEFRGPGTAVNQVRLSDSRYVPERAIVALGFQQLRAPHQSPTQAIASLLRVLGRVVTLRTATHVDFAIALDWYKTPVDGVSPKGWPNTRAGDLVSRGKYWHQHPSGHKKQRECGLALVELLVEVIGQHPLLCGIDSIAAAPGHDPKIVGFGSRLSAATAKRLGKPFIRCSGPPGFRTPAKDLDRAQLAAAIENKFVCQTSIRGQSVLVVDDVYRSGCTMTETARALRQAGAAHVAGLCPVRTMRS
jgi:hypothetical protein